MTIGMRSIVAIVTAAAIAGPAAGAHGRAPIEHHPLTRQKIEKKTRPARQHARTRQAEMRLVGRLGAGR